MTTHTFGRQVDKGTLYAIAAAMGLDEAFVRGAKFTTAELAQLLLEQAKTLRQAAVRRIRIKRSDFQRILVLNTSDPGARQLSIRARVDVAIPHESGNSIMHRMESPGFFGIRNDATETYLNVVFKEECDLLEHMLTALGAEIVE